MQKWDYRLLVAGDAQEVTKEAQQAGKEGWEAVSFVSLDVTDDRSAKPRQIAVFQVFMKRPIQ